MKKIAVLAAALGVGLQTEHDPAPWVLGAGLGFCF